MKNPAIKVTIEGDELVIRLPLNRKGKLSKSEKSRVVATTNGNIKTDLEVEGKRITLGVNAYVSAD